MSDSLPPAESCRECGAAVPFGHVVCPDCVRQLLARSQAAQARIAANRPDWDRHDWPPTSAHEYRSDWSLILAALQHCGLNPIGVAVSCPLAPLGDLFTNVPDRFAAWWGEVVTVSVGHHPNLWLWEYRLDDESARRNRRRWREVEALWPDRAEQARIEAEPGCLVLRLRAYRPGQPGYVELVPGTREPGADATSRARWVTTIVSTREATQTHVQALHALAGWLADGPAPKARVGRPPSSGSTWASAEQFIEVVTTAMRIIQRLARKQPTQAVVAQYLTDKGNPCDDRRLREWSKRAGVTWADLTTLAQSYEPGRR